METITWQFKSEQALEDFVWSNLEALMGLKPLKRQYYASGMVCDILAVGSNQQLTIIELKNVEDRYVLAQLTRYYDALKLTTPFADEINYDVPVRLIAIAPQFHAQNLIDRKYSQLDVEYFSFKLVEAETKLFLELEDSTINQFRRIEIPEAFRASLTCNTAEEVEPTPKPIEPPKSLKKLLVDLPDERSAYVLEIRNKILNFDSRIYELGKTTSTQYGLQKGTKKELFSTKICAQILPLDPGTYYPRLMLLLPFPRKTLAETGRRYSPDKIKGFAWTEIMHKERWNASTEVNCYFYLGKTLSRYSKLANLEQYGEIYHSITGISRTFTSLDDLLMLALEEWRDSIDQKKESS